MQNESFARFRALGLLLSVVGALLILQLVLIQASAKNRDLRETTRKTYEEAKQVFCPTRGLIYDRWGHLLAGNKQVYRLGIALRDVISPVTIASTLSSVAGINYDRAYALASKPYIPGSSVYADLQVSVTPDIIKKLENLAKSLEDKAGKHSRGEEYPSLSGLEWAPHLQRSYPEGTMGSNLIGFYSFLDRKGECETGDGYFGVEEFYNDMLAGKPVEAAYTADPVKASDDPNVEPGASLILTIDRRIQAYIETVVDSAQKKTQAEQVTILVLDPKTGEILAMANTQRMDPNDYWNYTKVFKNATEINRSVTQLYEPGSVFKVLTMATGFETKTVDLNTTYLDTGYIELGGINIMNWDRIGHGYQSMQGCMQLSLNVCLAWVATQIGEKDFYAAMDRFGVGQRSNVDLPGEAVWPVLLPGQPNWTMLSLGTNAYGQGVNVTPIQLAMSISAVANHGEMMAPHVLKAIVVNGRQEERPLRSMGHPISAETADLMTELLARSLEEEASNALVEGYRVAGKTGTGSIADGSNGYNTNLTNASFVGWGPVDDPRFLVYIWLEKPKNSPWGSIVAAPLFSEVVNQLVVLMDIPPDAERQKLYSK
jgi:cell division protein FtsI/penicillin-binding protein 2